MMKLQQILNFLVVLPGQNQPPSPTKSPIPNFSPNKVIGGQDCYKSRSVRVIKQPDKLNFIYSKTLTGVTN